MDARHFQLLLDAVSDYAIYMLDPDGIITTWNRGAEEVKGYAAPDIIGQHFSRFFTAEDQASGLPDRILAAARDAGRHEAEGWRVRKDGRRFWCNAITQPVHDRQGRMIGFAKITRDITERMAGQRAVLEAEQRFRMLVDGVIDYAICMLDPNGVVTNWNTGAERLKGYTADEIVGHHFSAFYTREERAAGVPARVLEIAVRDGRHEAEGWRVRKDGSRFRASVVVDAVRDLKGALLGFAKVTRDITERSAAQEALRESEHQFRLLVSAVKDYALYMLDPNGNVISWNEGAERIKGYAADEIIGQHFSRFYTEPDRAAGVPARTLQAATRADRFEIDAWRVRKDGTLFWANVVIQAIRDAAGKLVGFAKITRDITERREAQLRLQEAQAQRDHAQKMDVMGKLTGGVAHDFNNLLMVVSGNILPIKRAVSGDPRLSRAVEAIEAAARRGASLTRQLLTFSRRQTMNPTVVCVGERIESIRNMLASSLGTGIGLVTTAGPDVWPVKADASELELAIVNLVLNARDATPAGGKVTISAANVTLSRGDTPAGIEGDFVAFSIMDTGAGIPPDVLPKVFEPFFTTKQVDKGSGLGLSQVHGFAHQSGGTVTIESALGKGTTVTIYLPRCHEGTGEEQTEAAAEAAGGGTVLVVEDNPDVQEVSISMLQQLGYEVQGVSDAAAALAAIEERNFDLVVCDIVMPGSMDGIGLARVLRERRPDLPVLLVTGYSQSAAAATEFTVMRKPFQLPDISRVAARMIAQARQPATSNLVKLSDARRDAGSRPTDR
jgi:PAS domain S-box-containing protein